MPVIDFETLFSHLRCAQNMDVMTGLLRSSLYHGLGNEPVVLILTDTEFYYGGSHSLNGGFVRVPLNGVLSAEKVGKLIWVCVKLTHLEVGGEKTVYICPFTGSYERPIRDEKSIDALLKAFNQR